MVITPKTCFVHIRKTGGTWVRGSLLGAVDGAAEYKVDDDVHVKLEDRPDKSLFAFAFVRNPFTWYQSYFRYRIENKWPTITEVDDDCRSVDFAEFVDKITSIHPGVYSRWVQDAVGRPRKINFVGRQEYLKYDLYSALNLAGEKFSELVIDGFQPRNCSDKTIPAILSNEIKEKIRQSEEYVFREFGYR